MGLILAVEASSRTYAVAVGDGKLPAAACAGRRGDPGFAGVGGLAGRVLEEIGAEFSAVETVAVDVGPGGLSSIRGAVAYANGLAFSLGVKIFPVSSLELMAIEASRGNGDPVLCLKRGQNGNAYAGLFVGGEVTEMRHGPLGAVVPQLAAGLTELRVAGMPTDEVASLLTGVNVLNSGVTDADVSVLYAAARCAPRDPERFADAVSPLNEGSSAFHETTRGSGNELA